MRGYDEFLAALFDHVGGGVVALVLLLVAVLTGLLWYSYPAWVPRRFPRVRLPRPRFPRFRFRFRFPKIKWRRAKKPKAPKQIRPDIVQPDPETPVTAPAVPAGAMSLADRLAAEGRYAEAIRERHRESVAALTRTGVIPAAPAWTAHEVAATASANRPAVSAPLSGATAIFSEVWYGHRPADLDKDARMRLFTAEVQAVLDGRR